jgi:hypothetical protein
MIKLLLALMLIGCQKHVEVQYVPVDLSMQLKHKPFLPKVFSGELQCLKQETYQKLYDRERLIKEDALSCRAIVESTKQTVGD